MINYHDIGVFGSLDIRDSGCVNGDIGLDFIIRKCSQIVQYQYIWPVTLFVCVVEA